MIDKEYLKKLKKEDYIAWDNLVNDPIIKGNDTISVIVVLIPLIAFTLFIYSLLILNK